MSNDFERLGIETQYEVRQKGESRSVAGYASVFNSMSEDLGGFREIITPGAFRSVLDNKPDIRALINHDTGRVIGRTAAGTLSLEEDRTGLRFNVSLPPTPEGNALYTSIQRGDISGASFGFRLDYEDYDVSFQGEELIREIRNIAQLYEISVVTFPAYRATEVSARHAKHILNKTHPGNHRSSVNALRIKLLNLQPSYGTK